MTTCATSYGIMCDTVDEFPRRRMDFANSVNNLGGSHHRHRVRKANLHPVTLLHFLGGRDWPRNHPRRRDQPNPHGRRRLLWPEHATRMAQHAGDDPFMPTYLEQLIVALGGTPVDYDSKCQSVGAPALLTLNKPVMKMTAAAVLADAKSSGADLMVSACTMCHTRTLTPTNPRLHVKISGKNTSHANRAPR